MFPLDDHGRRSTTAVGRAVVADALRPVDAAGARAAEQETGWRSDYLVHFRRLVEAGVRGRGRGADRPCRTGQPAVPDAGPGRGDRERVTDWSARRGRCPGPAEVVGTGEPETELSLPFRGHRLRGDGLRRQVDNWVAAGVVEPTVADAVGAVIDQPDWLRLEGRTVAVLGAGAEMGPLIPLLRWGARVAAVDLPRPAIWTRVLGRRTDGPAGCCCRRRGG